MLVPMVVELEKIWDEFGLKLKQFILKRVKDKSAAGDILQEVFLKIHTGLDGLKDESKLESWIFQVTRNAIADHFRRQRPQEELSEELTEDLSDDKEIVEELAPCLKEMIDSLPDEYRQALILTEYEGLTQTQLAERLGISVSGAKSRVQRGRGKLKEMLLACCHFELDKRGKVIDYWPNCACCQEGECSHQK